MWSNGTVSTVIVTVKCIDVGCYWHHNCCSVVRSHSFGTWGCLSTAQLPGNMPRYLRDWSAQFCVLPHWDRSCTSNFLFHPVTVYWHRASQSQHWTYHARRNRVVIGVPIYKSLVRLDLEEDPGQKWESNPGLPLSRQDTFTTRPPRQ